MELGPDAVLTQLDAAELRWQKAKRAIYTARKSGDRTHIARAEQRIKRVGLERNRLRNYIAQACLHYEEARNTPVEPVPTVTWDWATRGT